MKIYFYKIIVIYILVAQNAYTQNIYTVAGNGIKGYSGDNGPAINAEFLLPFGVAVDNDSDLFVSDHSVNIGPDYCNCIRKINKYGLITTIAGGGFDVNDGIPATTAILDPFGILINANGNIMVADWNSNRIRVINSSGIIYTVAGNSIAGYKGDGGLAVNAELNGPVAMAVDKLGNIYIVDELNSRVRKVDTLGFISTVAGNGSYIYSGDGTAATASGLHPSSIAVDKYRNIFLTDDINFRILKVDTLGIITTVAGNGIEAINGDGGPAFLAQVSYPGGIAIDNNGYIYFGDGCLVRAIDTDGVINKVAGTSPGISGDGGPAIDAQLSSPSSIAIDNTGVIYVADENNYRIRKISNSGIVVNGITTPSVLMGSLNVFPNPNAGSFTLQLPQKGGSAIVTITDIFGSTIETRITQNTQPQNLNFDLHVPPGTYIVKVSSGDNICRQKIQIW